MLKIDVKKEEENFESSDALHQKFVKRLSENIDKDNLNSQISLSKENLNEKKSAKTYIIDENNER